MDADAYRALLNEAVEKVSARVKEYENAHQQILIQLYEVGRDTIPDFAKFKRTTEYRHIWAKVSSAVNNVKKNRKAVDNAKSAVLRQWGDSGDSFIKLNPAQEWQKAAGRLARSVPDYHQAMSFLRTAVFQRLMNVRRGVSLSLTPGLTDLLQAISYSKNNSPPDPVLPRRLAEIGLRIGALGLLELVDPSTGEIEDMSAEATEPHEAGFGQRRAPMPDVPSTIGLPADRRSEAYSASAANDEEPANNQTDNAQVARTGSWGLGRPWVLGRSGPRVLGQTSHIGDGPEVPPAEGSDRDGNHLPRLRGPTTGSGDVAISHGHQTGASHRNSSSSSAGTTQRWRRPHMKEPKGKERALDTSQGQEPGEESGNLRPNAQAGPSVRLGGARREDATEQPATASKETILLDLFNRLECDAREIPPTGEPVHIENLFSWWKEPVGHGQSLAQIAVKEIQAFLQYHEGANLLGLEYGLVTQLVESDPVLWLVHCTVHGQRELVAVPQPLIMQDQSVPTPATLHDRTTLSSNVGQTSIELVHAGAAGAITYYPTLLPVFCKDGVQYVSVIGQEIRLEDFAAGRRQQRPCLVDFRRGAISQEHIGPSAIFMSLRGISPLSEAILSQRPYGDQEVQMEIEILLGTDRDRAWDLIRRWRMLAQQHISYHFELWMEGLKRATGRAE